MALWLAALAMSTGLPLIAWAVIGASLGTYDRALLDAVEAQFGTVPPDVIDSLRLARLCVEDAAARAELGPLCVDAQLGTTLQGFAVVAAGISALVLVAVLAIARFGQGSRAILAAAFRPVLVLVLVSLVVVMAIDGALVVGALYLAQSAFLEAVWPWTLGVAAIAVLVAMLGVLQAIVAMARIAPVAVHGVALDRESDPALFNLIDDLSSEIGTDRPDQVLAGLDPTFFVIQAPVDAFGVRFTGRTLFVSIPLCRLLSTGELRAVLAHELGHFKGADTAYSLKFAPAYRAASDSLGTLDASARGLSGVPLLPSLWVLRACVERFAIAERAINRQRELAADAVGAAAGSARDLASALLKLRLGTSAWDEIVESVIRAVRDGRDPGNVAERYADRVRAGTHESAFSAHATEDRIAHPFDSHPRIDDRLVALGVHRQDILEQASMTRPESPAIGLIGDAEELELELSERMEEFVAAQLGVPLRNEGIDRMQILREAAGSDPAIAAAIALFEAVHGRDAGGRATASGMWRVLANLQLAVHPEPHGMAISYEADLPGGDQFLVVGLARPDADPELVLRAGMQISLAGRNDPHERWSGYEEDYYIDGSAEISATRLVVVRGVGTVPLEHQLAGLFVVPVSDPLAIRGGPFGAQLNEVIEGLTARAERVAAE